MFYVTDATDSLDNLESGTTMTFYVPFLVQSDQKNTQLLIPTGADFNIDIATDVTDGGTDNPTFNPTYTSGSKSIGI